LQKIKIQVKRLTPKFGAEIFGVDISKDLSNDLISEIRSVFLEFGVIFFRDQKLTPENQVRFGEYFAELSEYPFVEGLKESPLVIPVLKLENETINFGGIWHSDTAYLPEPPMGTILYAIELPPVGGDTLFANMYEAYDTLSEGMKKMLSRLKAINSAGKQRVSDTRAHRLKDSGKDTSSIITESIHPVIRTHPETGRKVLYINKAHTIRFDGMTAEESEPILNYLYNHQKREEFLCRFRWTKGAVAFWDNRCTQHYPLNDYDGHKRHLNRVTLRGDRPS